MTKVADKSTRRDNAEQTLAVAFLCLTLMIAPEAALAAGNPVQSFLDGVIGFLNSGVMRSVAILAVISMGVAAYLGKISWELAMKVGAGVILTFGAAALVDQFSGYVG